MFLNFFIAFSFAPVLYLFLTIPTNKLKISLTGILSVDGYSYVPPYFTFFTSVILTMNSITLLSVSIWSYWYLPMDNSDIIPDVNWSRSMTQRPSLLATSKLNFSFLACLKNCLILILNRLALWKWGTKTYDLYDKGNELIF